MISEWNNLGENEVRPIAVLYNCLRKHDLLLTDHLDVTFVVTMDYFELLTENSSEPLGKDGENLEFTLLDESLLGCKHASIRVFFSGDFCGPANFIRVISVFIYMQVLHVAFPWVDGNFSSDIIFLNVENQHEVVVKIILLLEDKGQKVDILLVLLVLNALKRQLDLEITSPTHMVEDLLHLDVLHLLMRLKDIDIIIVLNESKVLLLVLVRVQTVFEQLPDLLHRLLGKDIGP